MCEIVEQLFHRHYLEGLILGVASAGLFVKSLRSGKTSAWSAIAYFAAMAAKEVYIPLIVVLAAIPEGEWRARARRLVPHCVALLLYAMWRVSMLGPAVEGYGLTVRRSEWAEMIATAPWRAVKRMGGEGGVQSILFLTVLAICMAIALIRTRPMRPLIVAMFFAALLPIVPMATQMETRFVLTLWICAVTAAAAAPRLLLVPLLVATIFANRAEWSSTFRKTDRMAREARFFGQMKRGQILSNPLIPPGAMPELAWLTKSAGAWLYDDVGICSGEIHDRLFAWYEPLQTIRARAVPFVKRTSCREVAVVPLNATFHWEAHSLFWQLGPYHNGTYAFVLGNGSQAFDVPRDAGFRMGDAPGIRLRVRYTSPADWVTYSPEIPVDFKHDPDVTWRR